MKLVLFPFFTIFFAIFETFAFAANTPAGAKLWTSWVTNNHQRLSFYSNKEQIDREEKIPPKERDPTNTHPSAFETRWFLDDLMMNIPSNSSMTFIAMEIGGKMCYPEDQNCQAVIFGLTDHGKSGNDVHLQSYDTTSDDIKAAFRALHNNPQLSEKLFDYEKLQKRSYEIVYHYGYNETEGMDCFYGEGDSTTGGGYRLVVQESILPNMAKPLELFYDKDGTLLTDYSTPIEYKLVEN